MDIDNKKNLIKGYNNWIHENELNFIAVRVSCPYYKISLKTLQKLNPEHLKIFNQFAKTGKHISYWPLWDEIFRQANYQTKIKSKKIRGINFKINKSLSHLINKDYLLSYTKSKGLFLPGYHFKWMRKNELIQSLKIIDDKELFSQYQLLILDKINWLKKTSLEYPNPKYFYGRQVLKNGKWVNSPGLVGTELLNWQDSILINKDYIIKENEKIEDLIYFLEVMRTLDDLIFEKALTDFEKIKSKCPKEKSYKLNDIYNNLRSTTYKFYISEFEKKFKKFPLNVIKKWAYNILPAWAIRHNPLLQISKKFPLLLKILKSEEKSTQTIFRNDNEIKLANFYIYIIQQLNYYLEIATGKNMASIEELLSYRTDNKDQICPICSDIFIPNQDRKGGRKQMLCGKNNCKREWDKNRQKRYRNNKKTTN